MMKVRMAAAALASVVMAVPMAFGQAPGIAAALPGTTCSFFPADSVFNADISALPVNAQSTTWMGNMTQNANLHPDLGTFGQWYGIPINVAPTPASGVTPTFTYNPESDHPAEGYPIDQNTWIEGGPAAPSGSDRHGLVVDKNLCKLYEIYNLQNFTSGQTPQAGSGAVWNMNSNAMRPDTWTSADAAGLPMAPLLLRPDEILAGSIAHAIRFTAHCTANAYIWPASHQAGSCSSAFPPMGARFRLRSSFDISGFSATTQVVLRAFQHYGLILADNGSDWFFGGSTDDWWGTAAGSTVVSELKTIPANQFDAVDESKLQAVAGSYQAAASRVAALPRDRLHFGLSNNPDQLSWMTTSGVPWRYRYLYLAGGVNTSNPWQNWNSPPGAYAANFMNSSGANGYVPVFTYYELLQSLPSTGSNESDRDFSNLNNTSTMAAFYANFKLLLQTAGAYGKAVVVHVEPDLWGYLEQRAGGQDASTLTASVASSGFAEAAGIPNTAQGFAWTLLKLRDMYAPNAILALHASAWGSGIDIASSTDPTVNPASVADATAAFLNSAGITSNPYGSTWDVVFNDLDDHDAGWWEAQGSDNANLTHWWDPTNTKFPNFSRYLAWVGELRAKTARPQIAWQVPVGNQYYLTMNNTCGHYQDNVAQYFISHPNDLFNAGLIAVLFGAGNACQTTYTDTQGDGVTNNSGAPTTDTLGYCNACNTQASIYSDDDGGYLRVFVGQYYGVSAHPWKGLYTLDAYGGAHPADSPPLAGGPSFATPLARAARAAPGVNAPQNGLILDAYGGLHSYGSPVLQIGQEPYYPNLDVARDFVFLPSGTGGYELDAWGGIHPFSIGANPMPPAAGQYPYFPGLDVAKKIELLADASGGYVLDAYGGLHPWSVTGHALPVPMAEYGYWYGQNIARDIWFAPASTASSGSGYVLDAYGGFHPFWSAAAPPPPTMAQYGYWYGNDIARGVWFIPGSTASTATGYTLDAFGGLHPFTSPAQSLPAPISQYAYWPGRDIARAIWGA